MEKMEKKQGISEKKPVLIDVATAAILAIESVIGVPFVKLCSSERNRYTDKARIAFCGILNSYGISSGKIAQLIFKRTTIIDRCITTYTQKIRTSKDIQAILAEVNRSIDKKL
ncbi:MAG: hypothetical protein SNH99_01910 [Rikenellaceae bacterium]